MIVRNEIGIYRMFIDHLNRTIDSWIDALPYYNIAMLRAKPHPASWSLGQVYMHLWNDTNFYIGQVELCLSNVENLSGRMTEFAEMLFLNKEFPDEKIKGDASGSTEMQQPENIDELQHKMQQLKVILNSLWKQVVDNSPAGKTRHPGLGYFNASEWLLFTEIHMRHHLRQKQRIEEELRLMNQYQL